MRGSAGWLVVGTGHWERVFCALVVWVVWRLDTLYKLLRPPDPSTLFYEDMFYHAPHVYTRVASTFRYIVHIWLIELIGLGEPAVDPDYAVVFFSTLLLPLQPTRLARRDAWRVILFGLALPLRHHDAKLVAGPFDLLKGARRRLSHRFDFLRHQHHLVFDLDVGL